MKIPPKIAAIGKALWCFSSDYRSTVSLAGHLLSHSICIHFSVWFARLQRYSPVLHALQIDRGQRNGRKNLGEGPGFSLRFGFDVWTHAQTRFGAEWVITSGCVFCRGWLAEHCLVSPHFMAHEAASLLLIIFLVLVELFAHMFELKPPLRIPHKQFLDQFWWECIFFKRNVPPITHLSTRNYLELLPWYKSIVGPLQLPHFHLLER